MSTYSCGIIESFLGEGGITLKTVETEVKFFRDCFLPTGGAEQAFFHQLTHATK